MFETDVILKGFRNKKIESWHNTTCNNYTQTDLCSPQQSMNISAID